MEGYLRSGKTYFVVAGAAHMGGANGVLALLRHRGYRIEQTTALSSRIAPTMRDLTKGN